MRTKKEFILIILIVLGIIMAWYLWPISLTSSAYKVAHSWISNDLNRLMPYLTNEEKGKIDLDDLQKAYNIIVKEKLGGLQQVSPIETINDASDPIAYAVCNLKTGDGTQIKIGFIVFKEDKKISTQGLQFLAYLLERYYNTKEGIEQIDARLKAYQTLKEELSKVGIQEIYDFHKNEWRSFDAMIESCQLIIAWRDNTQKN